MNTSLRKYHSLFRAGIRIFQLVLSGLLAWVIVGQAANSALEFEGNNDIGNPSLKGGYVADAALGAITVRGGGANMWFTNDSFHFVWKKVGGDVAFSADVELLGTGVDPHRKAVLMIRQSLDADSAYADAALHGDGLTSLQYREFRGSMTREIQAGVKAPRRLKIEKRGAYVSMSVAGPGGEFQPAGGTFRIEFREPFLVGIGVCAHNDTVIESARFSNLALGKPVPLPTDRKPGIISTLETVAIGSKDRRVTWWTTNLIEAPNWTRDGARLLFNSRGRIFSIPAAGGEPVVINTGFAIRNNNDHGLSPDGSRLVISDQSQPDRKSRIYTLPISGGDPVPVVEAAPSYWHGWSPDGETLVYCAQRNGEFDIYSIPVKGGAETRLTSAAGLDDGPDFSHDGRFIYFNSDRTGQMQIWRMKPDGSDQQPVTNDKYGNWFPHPSPDGRWLVFLSYEPWVQGHPENKDVQLRLLSLADGKMETLAKLFGGQGTINVPSWSPDSRKLAFVSYQFTP